MSPMLLLLLYSFYINLTLSRFLSLLPNICLLFVFANANQITCAPNQHCSLHCTETVSSCASVTINASESTSLTLYCNDDYSCEYSTVLCPSESPCHIFCNGQYSCSDSIIHSNSSSELYLYCSQHRSCFLSTIFGAKSLVHIDCSQDRSCISSTFHLNTTRNITVMCHHTDNTDYDHSCSTNCFHVDNASYAHFSFEGNSAYGYKGGIANIIYAMYITHALWIECAGFRCSRNLDIYCPYHAPCIVSTNETDITVSSLDIMELFIPNQSYHHLHIICDSSTTCSSSDRRIIRCIDTQETSVIGYHHNDDKWYCFLNDNRCCPHELIKNDTIYCDTEDCIIDCNDDSSISCSFITVDATVSASLTMHCNGGYQCQGSRVLCPERACNIVCSTHHSCQYMSVDSADASLESLHIQCKSNTTSQTSYECIYMQVNTYMAIDAHVNITCGDGWSTRSCIWSEFNFHSVANTGNVYIICNGIYSCQYTSWYVMTMNAVSFECNARSSCELSTIDIANSVELNILCDSKLSCYASDIVCPTSSCSIQCSDYAQSCRYLDIISSGTYVNINIECPVNPVYNNVCNNMESYCNDNDINPTLIMYNESSGMLQCSDTICCPWIPTVSPTNIPTFVPTIEPITTFNPTINAIDFTFNPTVYPTINPSSDPTTNPTLYPTIEPTIFPTKHPSYIPTLEPTINPTMEPSIHPTNQPSTAPTIEPSTFIPSTRPIGPPHAYPTIDPSTKSISSPKPTIRPISETASNLTKNPSVFLMNYTTSYVLNTVKNAQLSSYTIRDKHKSMYIMLLLILSINIIILICIFKYNQTALNVGNQSLYVDDQKYVPVILYCVQIFDLYSDIIFSAQLYEYHIHSANYKANAFYYLFIASVLFIVIPFVFNCCSSVLIILNITHDAIVNTHSKQYLKDNTLLYIIGVLLGGGSFETLELLNTNLMGMERLHCGLSSIQLQRFLSHKLFCTTLFQNIPNFVIQLLFIVQLNVITNTVVISNASTLFNILLNVCISVIVYVTWRSKDQRELPLIISVSWDENDNEQDPDPYIRFGYRMTLSLELNTLYYPHEFEILSSERRDSNAATMYGVIKMDRSYSQKQKEIEAFLNANDTMKQAIINAFGYEMCSCIVHIGNDAYAGRDGYISREMQMLLPQIWEGVDRHKIGMSDDIFNKLDSEIRRLNDGNDSIETEMKMKLSTHFVD